MTESQDASLLQRRARRRVVGAIALVVLIVIALPIVLDKEPSPVGQDLVIQIPSQEAGKFNTRVLPPSAPAAAPANSDVAGTAPSAPAAAPAKTEVPGTAPSAPAAAPAKTEVPGTAPSAPAAAPAKSEVPVTAPAAPAARPAESQAAPVSNAKPDAAAPAKDSAAKKDESDAARAKALLEGKEAWVVRLGAFSNLENVTHLRAKLTAAGLKSYTETVKGPKGLQTRVRAGPFNSKQEAEQAQEKLAAAGVSPGTVGPR